MRTSEARVIDPILSNHARGYRHPEHVGHLLFPRVGMPVRGMKRIEFGRESFMLYQTRRAPGAATKRIEFGYQGAPVALDQHSLEGKVPFEHLQDAARVPGLDLAQRAVNTVLRSISLSLEVAQATKARDANAYDANHKLALAGADKWSDPAASKPRTDVTAAKEAIRSSIGVYPNTMIMGPKVFTSLQDHEAVREQFKYTGRESITKEMLAAYFDLERVEVGKAVYLPEGADAAADFTDAWGADVVLAYVPVGEEAIEVPSYGYTYQLEGTPYVEQPYSERNAKSWIYPVTDEHSAELVGASAGFLIQGAA